MRKTTATTITTKKKNTAAVPSLLICSRNGAEVKKEEVKVYRIQGSHRKEKKKDNIIVTRYMKYLKTSESHNCMSSWTVDSKTSLPFLVAKMKKTSNGGAPALSTISPL